VAERPYLFYSELFQFFIRGEPDFQRVNPKNNIGAKITAIAKFKIPIITLQREI
jgi:hypothetical protein